MASRREKRLGKKAAKKFGGYGLPKAHPFPISKIDLASFYQGVPQKPPILKEDIQKLHDPLFFRDGKIALRESITEIFLDAKIRTIEDLTNKSVDDLLALPGFGKVSLQKTRDVLKHFDLTLLS